MSAKANLLTKPLLFCLLFFSSFVTKAKEQVFFTEKSSKVFSQAGYEGIIWDAAKVFARTKKVSMAQFEENFNVYFNEIYNSVKPDVVKRFEQLEKGYKELPGENTKAFRNLKSLYQKELKNAVRNVLTTNQLMLNKLIEFDDADRIISFHSKVVIDTAGELLVTEQIKIYNGSSSTGNNEIKRGITREFPTQYKNSSGLAVSVPFQLISVTRDGADESFKEEKLFNGFRFYFGKSTEYLKDGFYTYVITYKTAKQIIFHKDKDELYWNVNGTGWSFSTNVVSCEIVFPEKAIVFENNCYTGIQGSTSSDCRFEQKAKNIALFTTTRRLNPNEGMTISTTIAKGALHEPKMGQKLLYLVQDNYLIAGLLLFLVLQLISNFIFWWRVGRDPKAGIVIPQFEPPYDMSPADCGYLMHQKFKPHLFGASVVDYAVNKQVNIEVVKEKGLLFNTTVYHFQEPESGYERDYQRYEWYGYDIDSFFGRSIQKGTYNSTIASCFNHLQNKLESRLQRKKGSKTSSKGLFALNRNFVDVWFLILGFCFVAAFVCVLLLSPPITSIIYAAGILLIMFVVQKLFKKWMSAYTKEGRSVLDQVLGFKKYLETAEEKVLDQLNPPEKTLQLFEQYLPYAIALGCENRWAEKFESVIQKAMQSGYQPTYFRSNSNDFSSSAFVSSFSSGISSTVASASTPPSSSSGGSGGSGSSGGGGGGGGGGGW